MKKLVIALGAVASVCAFGETIDVAAGQTVKVEAGRRFEGDVLVKTGAGTLDLSGAVLRNKGLEIREGAALFSSAGSAAATCRYLRWNVTKTRPAKSAPPEYGNTGSQFSEFRLFRGGKQLPMPAKAAAITSNHGPEGPQKGLDGNLKTKCYYNPFVVDFGEEVTFDGYSFATANDAIGRDPYCWTVEAGYASAAGIQWAPIGSVQNFEAPKARFAEAGKVFPVAVSDVVPAGYPVKVCGAGRLVLRGASEMLESVSGDGLVQLEAGASATFGADCAFRGSVAGGGAVNFVK